MPATATAARKVEAAQDRGGGHWRGTPQEIDFGAALRSDEVGEKETGAALSNVECTM